MHHVVLSLTGFAAGWIASNLLLTDARYQLCMRLNNQYPYDEPWWLRWLRLVL
jgi:hypothetical protein